MDIINAALKYGIHGRAAAIQETEGMAQIEVRIFRKGQEIARVTAPPSSTRWEPRRQIQETVLAADQRRTGPSRQWPARG